jgi:hypothetical protein
MTYLHIGRDRRWRGAGEHGFDGRTSDVVLDACLPKNKLSPRERSLNLGLVSILEAPRAGKGSLFETVGGCCERERDGCGCG